MNGQFALALAIFAEVIATSMLKASEGFSRPIPAIITVIGYGAAFYLLSITLRTIPMGVAYGVWSAAGIVLISAVGWIAFGQRLDVPAMIGLGFIIAGVLVVNFSSTSAGH